MPQFPELFVSSQRQATSALRLPFLHRSRPAEPHAPAQPALTLWGLVKPHAARYRWWIALALILNAIPGFGIAFQTFVPKYLVDDVLIAPDLAFRTRLVRLGFLLTGWVVSALVLRMLAWYGSYRIFTHVRERIVMELRARFFRHINALCLRFHHRQSSGELFSYVFGAPVAVISGFYHTLVMNVPNALCTFLLSTGWMLLWDRGLTVILLGLVVATVCVLRRSSSDLRQLHEEFQAIEGAITGRVADIFRGNRDVKMYAIEEAMSRAFDQSADTLRQKTCERDLKTHRVNMRHEVVGAACFVIVTGVGVWRYFQGGLTPGEILAYLGAYGMLQVPVSLLFQIGTAYEGAQASLKRLADLLYTETSTPDPSHDPQEPPPKESLVLRHVSFTYTDQPVLRDINLHIPFGQRVALVGPSGVGKSTLAKLLLRLYDPGTGSVSMGGVDLRDCRGADIRRRYGVVPQDPYFFHASIRHNLAIVHPAADETRMREVCELANAWEFIRELPHQLDTVIGEGGCRLSAGQRQRLAIARALLHEPEYFIFDEATSALDTLSERLVHDALARVLAGRTAIFIAHRLSTIKDCDRIVVLQDHTIVQDGPFKELRHTPGLFRQMVEQDRF
ncbi:MAG: ABC transporter ATP-binding protein [Verrucomicrobia bacterium]|nr:ABC transporter ATP-binding protein [Verrucomicrobiota bacterium]